MRGKLTDFDIDIKIFVSDYSLVDLKPDKIREMIDLKRYFETLCRTYSEKQQVISNVYSAIEKAYKSSGRFYHNLQHIENLIEQLEKYKSNINKPEIMAFSIFYHDVVYDVKRKDNEEQSVFFAQNHLRKLNASELIIEKVSKQILATKTHCGNSDSDTELLLDFDLSILGSEQRDYENYAKAIRNEYSIYPDNKYNAGRKNVLEKMLAQKSIYKTEIFRKQLEAKARQNIRTEIESFL